MHSIEKLGLLDKARLVLTIQEETINFLTQMPTVFSFGNSMQLFSLIKTVKLFTWYAICIPSNYAHAFIRYILNSHLVSLHTKPSATRRQSWQRVTDIERREGGKKVKPLYSPLCIRSDSTAVRFWSGIGQRIRGPFKTPNGSLGCPILDYFWANQWWQSRVSGSCNELCAVIEWKLLRKQIHLHKFSKTLVRDGTRMNVAR